MLQGLSDIGVGRPSEAPWICGQYKLPGFHAMVSGLRNRSNGTENKMLRNARLSMVENKMGATV